MLESACSGVKGAGPWDEDLKPNCKLGDIYAAIKIVSDQDPSAAELSKAISDLEKVTRVDYYLFNVRNYNFCPTHDFASRK